MRAPPDATMMRVPGAAELEVKLRLPRDAVARLLRHPAVASHKQGRARKRRLVSTYFDTVDLRLADAGIGLWLRRSGRKWLQSVEGPPESAHGNGLVVRPTYEWPIGSAPAMPGIDTARLAKTPWRRALLKAARHGFQPAFTTDVTRMEWPLAWPDDTSGALAVDIGEIRAASDSATADVCEIELAFKTGRVERLFALAGDLANDLPLSLERASLEARGVRLASAVPQRPERALNARIPDHATAGEALALIAAACVRQLEGNANGLLTDDDPEWVHQMRIGTRRLRACLGMMRDLVAAGSLTPLTDELKWLAGAIGPARDLDVLATETLPAVIAGTRGTGDAATVMALRRFAATVARRRKRARNDARAAVASARFVRLILAAGALAAARHVDAARSAASAWLAAPAREFARTLLARRRRKLLRYGERLAQATAEDRHAVRIAAKKLRYATEFFADLFGKKRARAYRAALMQLQDTLGALNDASVAARVAREIAGPASTTAATLQGWVAAQSVQADALAAAWRDFSRCKPFWERG